MAYQPFAERHHVFQVREGGFGLEHPEFREVAPRFRFFRAKRGAKTINLAQRRRQGFAVELAGLRQVSFLIVDVLHFKKCGRAFAGRGREDGRVGESVALARP